MTSHHDSEGRLAIEEGIFNKWLFWISLQCHVIKMIWDMIWRQQNEANEHNGTPFSLYKLMPVVSTMVTSLKTSLAWGMGIGFQRGQQRPLMWLHACWHFWLRTVLAGSLCFTLGAKWTVMWEGDSNEAIVTMIPYFHCTHSLASFLHSNSLSWENCEADPDDDVSFW